MSLDFISPEAIQEVAQQYGYWAIFVGILLENLGLPIPGETVTLAGGFLAGNDQLNYWLVLGDAAAGAIIGGHCGYWIGRYGGWAMLLKVGRLVRMREEQLEGLRSQFIENAGKAILFGRFIALLRIFASPLAGIAGMPYWKFMGYNVAGACAWASVMVSLAFFAGQVVPLEKLIALASQFTIVALLIVIAWVVVPLWLESRKAKQEAAAVVDPQPAGDSE